NVRSLHLVAKVVHHLGNAGHADAANADEVDDADVESDALHAMLSTRSARSLAACGRPQAWARRAAFSSAPGSSASFCICLASSTAVKRGWAIARAPPAFAISRAL